MERAAASSMAWSRALVIRPTRGWRFLDVRELWAYRELVYFLAWRDVKVRYKQTAIGVAWVVLQPLVMMGVFTVLFGKLAGLSSQGAPYPLFAYVALLPWKLFSQSMTDSTQSLVTNQRLITKVYFPRIIVPMASCLAALVDFVISAALLLVLMPFYGVAPGARLAWLPLLVLIMLATALGAGLWLSALNVEYRDVAYTIPFLTQLWFFLTPVVYASSLVPERWRTLYALNPMVGVVEGFRWALLGVGSGPSAGLMVSSLVGAALLVSGIAWFRRLEATFADVVGS